MSKLIIHIGLSSALIIVNAVAAAPPNLSGTWKLDSDKSDQLTLGQRGGQSILMTITQTAVELRITRVLNVAGSERTLVSNFALDGKPQTNPSEAGGGNLTATARWEHEILIIEGIQSIATRTGIVDIGIRDEYTLSPEGDTLTITSTRTTPQGSRTVRQVFRRE